MEFLIRDFGDFIIVVDCFYVNVFKFIKGGGGYWKKISKFIYSLELFIGKLF